MQKYTENIQKRKQFFFWTNSGKLDQHSSEQESGTGVGKWGIFSKHIHGTPHHTYEESLGKLQSDSGRVGEGLLPPHQTGQSGQKLPGHRQVCVNSSIGSRAIAGFHYKFRTLKLYNWSHSTLLYYIFLKLLKLHYRINVHYLTIALFLLLQEQQLIRRGLIF